MSTNFDETTFDPNVGPAQPGAPKVVEDGLPHVDPFTTLEEVLNTMKKPDIEPTPETRQNKVPEYLTEENAKSLYEQEVQSGGALSPLSVMYYLSLDKDDRYNKNNVDLRGALEEQGKIVKLLISKQKLTSIEWETALQNTAGWKEIKEAIGEDNFFDKTRRYLSVKVFNTQLNKENDLMGVLSNTADLIKSNLTNSSNGA